MRFLIDENIAKKVVDFLKTKKYQVKYITDIQVGLDDFEILDLANLRNSILITFDRDFGELVFKYNYSHKGVIYLKLENQSSINTIKALTKLLKSPSKIEKNFIVVAEKQGKFKIRVHKVDLNGKTNDES